MNNEDLAKEADDVVGFFILNIIAFLVIIIGFVFVNWLLIIAILILFCNYIFFIDHPYISKENY